MTEDRAATRLVRFTSVYSPRSDEDRECEDAIILDARIDEDGIVRIPREMFGFELTHVGLERRKRFDLIRLQSDFTFLAYEDCIDPDTKRVWQAEHRGEISRDIRVRVGTKFKIRSDDEYEMEIIDVVEIMREKQ